MDHKKQSPRRVSGDRGCQNHRPEDDSVEMARLEQLIAQLIHLKCREEHDEERSNLRSKLANLSVYLASVGRFQEAAEVNLLLFEDAQKQVEHKKVSSILQNVFRSIDKRSNSINHSQTTPPPTTWLPSSPDSDSQNTFPILTKKLQQEQRHYKSKRICPESPPSSPPSSSSADVQYLALPHNSNSGSKSPQKKRRLFDCNEQQTRPLIKPSASNNSVPSSSSTPKTSNPPKKKKCSILNLLKRRQTDSKFMLNQVKFQHQSTQQSSRLPSSSYTQSFAKNPSRIYSLSSSHNLPPQFCQNPFIVTASQDWQLRFYKTTPCLDSVKFLDKISVVPGQWSITDLHLLASKCGNFISYSSLTPLIYFFQFPSFLGSTDSSAGSYSATKEKKPMLVDLRSPLNKDNDFGVLTFITSTLQKTVVAGTTSHQIFVYDLCKSSSISTINSHTDDVNSITFLDDTNQTIVSGSDDTLIKIFDLRQNNHRVPSLVLSGHYDGITYVDSRMDGIHLLSNSKDQTLKYWDIRACGNKAPIGVKGEKMDVEETKRGEEEEEEEAGREDYRGVDWKCLPRKEKKEGDKSVWTMEGHTVKKTLIRARFADGEMGKKWCASGSEDGKVFIWDLETGRLEKKLERKGVRKGGLIRDFMWEKEGRCIVGGGFDGELMGFYNCNMKGGKEEEDEEI